MAKAPKSNVATLPEPQGVPAIAARTDALRREPETAESARERAQRCYAKVCDVLRDFHCRLVPVLNSKPIGGEPVCEAIISASYGVIPEPLP